MTGLNINSSISNLVAEKSSYCFNTMSRIATMKKAIVQTEQLVNKTKETVEKELNEMLKNGNVAFELQKLNIRIRMLREQLDREKNELEVLRQKSLLLSRRTNLIPNLDDNQENVSLSNSMNDICQDMSQSHIIKHDVSNNSINHLCKNSSSLPNNISSLNLPVSSFSSLSVNSQNLSNLPLNSPNDLFVDQPFVKDHNKKIIGFDEENIKKVKMVMMKIENEISYKSRLLEQLNESLEFSECKLISELYEIFPIEESQETNSSFTVLGLQLPDLTDQFNENDVQIRISLGYCCQLLITISKVFDIPLRHNILFAGSQSWIANDTENAKLKDKKYPLFLNRDKTKFNIAIYLLNENIIQLRHHFNLPTPDYKKLSTNLFTLFWNKLLLKN